MTEDAGLRHRAQATCSAMNSPAKWSRSARASKGFAAGDLVSVIPLQELRPLRACLAGEPAWCAHFGLQGGGYAEYALTRANQCVKLPQTRQPRRRRDRRAAGGRAARREPLGHPGGRQGAGARRRADRAGGRLLGAAHGRGAGRRAGRRRFQQERALAMGADATSSSIPPIRSARRTGRSAARPTSSSNASASPA